MRLATTQKPPILAVPMYADFPLRSFPLTSRELLCEILKEARAEDPVDLSSLGAF